MEDFIAPKEWIPYIISAFLGSLGAIGGIIAKNKLASRDKVDREIRLRTIESIFMLATGLEQDEINVENISARLLSSQQVSEMFKKFVETTPKPYIIWIKKRIGKKQYAMMWHNGYYHDIFLEGLPHGYYIGKTDFQVWEPEEADQYSDNDEKVYRSGKVEHVVENVVSKYTGARGAVDVSKYGFQSGNDFYLCGIGVFKESEVSTLQRRD